MLLTSPSLILMKLCMLDLSCPKQSSVKFSISVKLREEKGLPQTKLNARFSMQIVFFTFLKKRLEPNFQWQHALVIFCLTHVPLG